MVFIQNVGADHGCFFATFMLLRNSKLNVVIEQVCGQGKH
jgi:hypothetical protein